MLIDLHAHCTETKDCFFDAHDVIAAARKAGLDGIVFADAAFHDDADELRGHAREQGFVVLFGREVYTSGGHVLVYAPDYAALQALPWDGASEPPAPGAVIDLVNKMGGAAVAAHPYCREGEHPMGDAIFALKGLAAIESENAARGKMTNDLAAEAGFSMQLPCCGGSDAKQSMDLIGGTATLFKKAIATEAELCEALKAGACWPVKIGDFPPKEDPRDRFGGRRDGGYRGAGDRAGGFRSVGGAQGRRDGRRDGFRGGGRPFDPAQGRRDDRRGGRGGHRDRGRGHGGGDRGAGGSGNA